MPCDTAARAAGDPHARAHRARQPKPLTTVPTAKRFVFRMVYNSMVDGFRLAVTIDPRVSPKVGKDTTNGFTPQCRVAYFIPGSG